MSSPPARPWRPSATVRDDGLAVVSVQPDAGWRSYRAELVPHLEGRVVVVRPGFGCFLPNQLALIGNLAAARDLRPAAVGPDQRVDANLRRARVAWLEFAPTVAWIFSRMLALGRSADREAGWHLDLEGPAPAVQISRYDSTDRGTFDWHVDIGVGRTRYRKIAVAIEIASAEAGGEFQCRTGSEPRTICMTPGTAAVFPADVQHRVTPVLRGQRLSVVAWICGAAFR